jgi:hypothetical protein
MLLRPTLPELLTREIFNVLISFYFGSFLGFGWPNRKGMVSEWGTGEQVPFEPWRRGRRACARDYGGDQKIIDV